MANPFQDVTVAILAGGLGTRLRPAIADRPKVLAPVAGVPFLSHLLRQIGQAGIGEAILLAGYKAEAIRATLGDRHADVRLRYSIETDLLGTAGAVREALPLIPSRTILLMNGDSYCSVDLPGLVKCHLTSHAAATLTLTWAEEAARFGQVSLQENDRIASFSEKSPDAQPGLINAGIYLLEREIVESVPAKVACSLERDLLPSWIGGGRVMGYRGGRFIDIGVPESYVQADAFFDPSLRAA